MRTISNVEWRPIGSLNANPSNARTHSKKQLQQIERSIAEFGFFNPVLVDEDNMIIAGHGRHQAATALSLLTIPVIQIDGLTKVQKRKLAIADNKIASNAGWDRARLAIEVNEIIVEDGDIAILGFEPPEIDQILLDHEQSSADPADEVPEDYQKPSVTKTGDLWLLGTNRILCGDARIRSDIQLLCGTDRPTMMFTDPPYNRRIGGLVGRGKRKHAEFQMASGEMSSEEFAAFLLETLTLAADICADGAVHFICMDWRGIDTLLPLCRKIYGDVLNIVVWVKSNGGQGSFYRSQYELIVVARVGDKAHLNNIELGRHGRNRSNVWHFAGVNSFRKGRLDELSMHPTVKPVALMVEALKDCTKRGDAVLDLFGGSGSTLIACERVGRQGQLLEIEPRYVDVTIRRWQKFTGKDAIHAVSKKTFDELERAASQEMAVKESVDG